MDECGGRGGRVLCLTRGTMRRGGNWRVNLEVNWVVSMGGGGGVNWWPIAKNPIRTILCLENRFGELHIWSLVSSKALRVLNAFRESPLYTVFRTDKKSEGSVEQKNRVKIKQDYYNSYT